MEHRYIELSELEKSLDQIKLSPQDVGKVSLIVARPNSNERQVLTEGTLDEAQGLVGDNWQNHFTVSRPLRRSNQIAIMNTRAIQAIAPNKDRWPLAGDQLFVDFDLSENNLTAGTKFLVGTAVLEVTVEPHLGCKKFQERFGKDALQFVNQKEYRSLKLRGIYAEIIKTGIVQMGDAIQKI